MQQYASSRTLQKSKRHFGGPRLIGSLVLASRLSLPLCGECWLIRRCTLCSRGWFIQYTQWKISIRCRRRFFRPNIDDGTLMKIHTLSTMTITRRGTCALFSLFLLSWAQEWNASKNHRHGTGALFSSLFTFGVELILSTIIAALTLMSRFRWGRLFTAFDVDDHTASYWKFWPWQRRCQMKKCFCSL